jgi:hypothetical protein
MMECTKAQNILYQNEIIIYLFWHIWNEAWKFDLIEHNNR